MPLLYWNDEVVLGPVTEAFAPAAAEVAAIARARAPRATGRLSASVNLIPTGPTSARLGAPGVPYLGAVLKGSKAHTEVPRTAQALKTPYGLFKSVQHPAVAADPFLQEAAASFRELYINSCRARLATLTAAARL